MKDKIQSKKTAVMLELAIIVFIIIFSVCALLIGLSGSSNFLGKNHLISSTEKTQLTQTAKTYLDNGVYNNGTFNIGNDNCTVTVSDYDNYGQKQFIFSQNGGKHSLTVILRPWDNNKIVTWTYSNN